MHSSIYLDLLIVVPLLGALAAMLARKVPNASFIVGIVASDGRVRALGRRLRALQQPHQGRGHLRLPLAPRPLRPARPGLGRGHRRHLAHPHHAHDHRVASRAVRGARATSRGVVRGLDAGADRLHRRQFRQPRRARVLHLLRAHPGAELLHHRGLGRGSASPRRAQVLHLHLWRVGVLVHRPVVPGLPAPAPDRGSPHLLGHRARVDGAHAWHLGVAVSRLCRRLRGEVADLAAAHLVAHHVRRSAHRRVDPTLRPARQARLVRAPALRRRVSFRSRS